MAKRQQLETDIFNNLSAMRRLWFQQFALTKPASGPTYAQMSFLFALSHKPSLSVKDLAQCFGMTSSGATQLINGLVKRGWVKRQVSPGDRRKVLLTLSADGQRRLKKIMAQRAVEFAKNLRLLSLNELQQLKSIQLKILASHPQFTT